MANSTTEKEEVLYLELIDRQNSGFVKEGSLEEGNPVYMDSPDRRRILSRSVMMGDKGELIRIRYIASCDSIIESEQEAKNVHPNPTTDIIWFEGGQQMTVRNTGRTKNLFAYLKNCEFNANAPKKPEGAQAIFREIHAEKVNEGNLEQLMLERQISNVMGDLYEKQGDEWIYDEEKINYLATLLGVDGDSPSAKLLALDKVAKSDPYSFLNTIADKTKSYRIDVLEAVKLDVIDIKGDKAVWVDGQLVFLNKFRVKSVDEKIEALIRYFLSSDGGEDYKTLVLKLDSVKEKMLALK